MEKLIELLNEYRKGKGERNLNKFEVSQTLDSLNYLRLFIKWLVDNDKIKMELLKYNYMDLRELVREADMVVMLLAISDTPIDDLISYLR